MGQLHAGGFWEKWNSDQFVREVRETKQDNISPMIENSIQIFLSEYVDKTPQKLQVYHFYFPLAIHGLGLSVAFLLLLLEMAWKTTFQETNKQHVGKKGKIFIVPIKQ